MGDPLVEGARVALEWWTQMVDADDGDVTLPGILLLTFSDGLCASLHEYWHVRTGRSTPYPGWGRMASDQTPGAARTWAERYQDAWRRRDPDAAAALYAEDAVVRTDPFRDRAIGRVGVRDYCEWAFGTESDVEPRLVRWAAASASAAVEWWASFYDADAGPVTLAGCSLLQFDAAGLVTEARGYWNQAEGRLPVPEWWGDER